MTAVRRLAAVAWLALSFGLARPAAAAELVMFDAPGCGWCARWKAEVGAVYPRTDEGRRLPLRVVAGMRPPAGLVALARPIAYTPTFVVADSGREIGRITGYAGEAMFWEALAAIVGKVPAGAAH